MLHRVVWQISTDVPELTASIIMVMIYQTTRCNIPENSHLHTRRRENLKSHGVASTSHVRKRQMSLERYYNGEQKGTEKEVVITCFKVAYYPNTVTS
jgi:hypothetical protein